MKKFFNRHYKQILVSIIGVSLFLFLLSIYEIAVGNIGGFQPLLYGFGFLLYSAFNWADVLIFTLLWIILSSILLKIKRIEFFWIVFFGFWFIRSCGETMYSFMQQFHPDTKPWLMYMPRAIMQHSTLGQFLLLKYWVVEQIFFQSLAVLSLFGLLYTIITMKEHMQGKKA